MQIKSNYDAYDWYSGNEAKTYTIIERDEVEVTQLLGPDGKPFAIRRPKAKMGFNLTHSKK